MGKWKYLGGELGYTDASKRPYVASVDMVLGVIQIMRIEEKGFFALQKMVCINTHSDLVSIQIIDNKLTENKTAQGVLAASGFLLAGPLGILAGFAAKKKDEVAFLLEVKTSQDVKEEKVRGKRIALLTRRKYFERILTYSGLGEKNVMSLVNETIQPKATSSVTDEIAKLSSLKEKSLLSDEEFSAAKAKLLGL